MTTQLVWNLAMSSSAAKGLKTRQIVTDFILHHHMTVLLETMKVVANLLLWKTAEEQVCMPVLFFRSKKNQVARVVKAFFIFKFSKQSTSLVRHYYSMTYDVGSF